MILLAFAYILVHKYTISNTHTKVYFTEKIYQLDLDNANC